MFLHPIRVPMIWWLRCVLPVIILKFVLLLHANTGTALNHRDHFLRQHLYPAPSFDTPLLADGCGVVKAVGSSASKSWIGKTVILVPGRGWKDAPEGPEAPTGYSILGGTKTHPLGTAQDVLVVEESEVEEAPAHLSPAQAAALPLTGLTGWRALMSKSGNAKEGRNILVTGIGGGVALSVLQFAVAVGANVWVTSGNQAKIDKAKEFGAKGGVIYKGEAWEKELLKQLPKDRPYLDSIIDGAGGDVVKKSVRLLKVCPDCCDYSSRANIVVKAGGTIVQYGMTVSPKMEWLMPAVLKNIELKGSTMGSRKEFKEMVSFVASKKIVPVVSRVVKGLDNLEGIDSLFEDIKNGSQFGKLVVEIGSNQSSKL